MRDMIKIEKSHVTDIYQVRSRVLARNLKVPVESLRAVYLKFDIEMENKPSTPPYTIGQWVQFMCY